jgi:hypothetical protein
LSCEYKLTRPNEKRKPAEDSGEGVSGPATENKETNILENSAMVAAEACPGCSKLDLDAAFSREGPQEVLSINRDQLVESCKLCNFLKIVTQAQ